MINYIFVYIINHNQIHNMDIPSDVLKLIASHITKHKMKLLDWISINDIITFYSINLSINPNAIDILKQCPEKISIENLACSNINPEALELLDEEDDNIYKYL